MKKLGALHSQQRFYRLLGLPALVLLTLLFVVPLTFTLSRAFSGDESLYFGEAFITLFRQPYTWTIIRFSLLQAFVSTIVSLLIAFPGAYLLANYRFRGKGFVKAICTLPFVLPSILVVLGFVIFYGNSGILNTLLMDLFTLDTPPLQILYSFKAIILAHAFYNFPIALSLISTRWENLSPSYEGAALTLGSNRWEAFRRITLPNLMSSVLSASSLIFLFCFSSFAILLVLGGGPQFSNIEVEIYRRAKLSGDMTTASALALISIVITLALVLLHLLFQRRGSYEQESQLFEQVNSSYKKHSLVSSLLIALYVIISFGFVLGPLGAIIWRSFTSSITRGGATQLSLKWYKELLGLNSSGTAFISTALSSVIYSFIIALISASIATVLGLMLSARLARKSDTDSLAVELYAMLPMAVSSVVVGLGYYLVGRVVGTTFSMRLLLVLLAHVVIASPFVIRSILPDYRSMSKTYMQAALTLGSTVRQSFLLVELPLLRSSIITGFAFAFAISMGEMNATLILSESNIVTIPVIMYRLIGSYNYSGACALGTLLIGVSVALFGLSEASKRRRYE
ncbi:MAG: iron ABC transporter permease [Sphaerochaetaceae bacterium]